MDIDNKQLSGILRPVWDLEQAICQSSMEWQKELARLIHKTGLPAEELTVAKLMQLASKADEHYDQLLQQGAI